MPHLPVCITAISLACLVASQGTDATAGPEEAVLSTIGQSADLSTFYSLLLSTGRSSSAQPGREFQERFNVARSGLQYTVFAPTNDAFSSVSPAIIEALTSIPAYQLLASLLRTHIMQGNITGDEILQSPNATKMTEGFMLTFSTTGAITINDNITETSVPIGHQAHLVMQDPHTNHSPIHIPASNGGVFKIDNFLNPYTSYFGIDAPTPSLPGVARHPHKGSMADVLRKTNELSNLTTMLQALNPDFLTRLSLYPAPKKKKLSFFLTKKHKEPKTETVFLAPGNMAFDAMPALGLQKALDPSNAVLGAELLEFGLGEYDRVEGVVRSVAGLNITVEGGRAGNARVEERICVENGCVWVVGRWLDPLFGVF